MSSVRKWDQILSSYAAGWQIQRNYLRIHGPEATIFLILDPFFVVNPLGHW